MLSPLIGVNMSKKRRERHLPSATKKGSTIEPRFLLPGEITAHRENGWRGQVAFNIRMAILV